MNTIFINDFGVFDFGEWYKITTSKARYKKSIFIFDVTITNFNGTEISIPVKKKLSRKKLRIHMLMLDELLRGYEKYINIVNARIDKQVLAETLFRMSK